MRIRQSPPTLRAAGRAAAALLALLCPAGAAHAQGQLSGPQPADMRPDVSDPKAAIRERQAREAMLRNTELLSRRPDERRPASPEAAEQVKQDFKQIQVLRNGLARRLKSEGPLDYEAVADAAREVNKRAGRLKSHLMPAAPDALAGKPKAPPEFTDEHLRDFLVILCRRIDSFTENPTFKVPAVLDVEQSKKAGGDLQAIIQLSDRVREGAERLHKTPGR